MENDRYLFLGRVEFEDMEKFVFVRFIVEWGRYVEDVVILILEDKIDICSRLNESSFIRGLSFVFDYFWFSFSSKNGVV